MTNHHLPEAVNSILRIVKLNCRTVSQVQSSNGLLTLQRQRHITDSCCSDYEQLKLHTFAHTKLPK